MKERFRNAIAIGIAVAACIAVSGCVVYDDGYYPAAAPAAPVYVYPRAYYYGPVYHHRSHWHHGRWWR